jgi:hypothetical protein
MTRAELIHAGPVRSEPAAAREFIRKNKISGVLMTIIARAVASIGRMIDGLAFCSKCVMIEGLFLCHSQESNL